MDLTTLAAIQEAVLIFGRTMMLSGGSLKKKPVNMKLIKASIRKDSHAKPVIEKGKVSESRGRELNK